MGQVKYLNAEQVFDTIHQDYEVAYGVEYPGFAAVLEKLGAMLPADAELLDAGCGTASLPGKLFGAKGYRYHGIDISQEMVNRARRNFPAATFTKGDMLRYEPERPLNALMAAHIFYQVPHHIVRAYLLRVAGWLKPDGILLLCSVPGEKREPDLSLYDPEWGYIDDKPTTFMGQPARQSFVTSAGWHKLVEACGFKIVESGEYGYESTHARAASEDTLFIFARRS